LIEGVVVRAETAARVAGGYGRLARAVARDVGVFGVYRRATALRPYQLEVARAVARAVIDGSAEGPAPTFTVLFPRQAGKNELSAHLEAFLLYHYSERGGSIVKAAPTFRPQAVNSLMRLERLLRGRLTRGQWRRRLGYIIELGKASCTFISAQPEAQMVGRRRIGCWRGTRRRTSRP
jgi:hypothetical protein